MNSLIGLVWRNLWAHSLRSTLTALAITLGVAMVLAASIVGQAAGQSEAELSREEGMGNVMLIQAGLAMAGLVLLFAAGFVILNAFAMSVTQRSGEIGALRALGMTRRQTAGLVLAEAGLLSLLGTAAGLLLGIGLACGVIAAMGSLNNVALSVPWWGLAASVAMGVGVTLAAALLPARRAGRVAPIVAVRAQSIAGHGWYVRSGGRVGSVLLAVLLTGLAVFGLLFRPNIAVAVPTMLLGQVILLGGAVLVLPGLIAPLARLCRPVLTCWLGAAGRLAVDNLRRNTLRAALTAGALAAGLTLIVGTSGLATAGLKGAIRRIRMASRDDAFITADLGQIVAGQEMTVENMFEFLTNQDLDFDLRPVIEALQPLVDAQRIELTRYAFQVVPAALSTIPGAPGLFVDPEPYFRRSGFEFFDGDVETARAWMLRGRAMLIAPIVAERLGTGVGDEVLLPTSRGEVAFTVAGIGGGGMMMSMLPYTDGEAYFGIVKSSFLGVAVLDHERVEATLAEIETIVAAFPGLAVLDYAESLEPVVDMIDQLELLLDGLLFLGVVVAALGVVNTMVINVAERKREIALLRAVGATRRQVRQAVVAEAAALGLLAALVAAGLGLLMLGVYGVLILPGGTRSVGVPADWETIRLTMVAGLRDWAVAALVALVFGPLVAGAAAYWPARQAARLSVIEAARDDR